MCKRILFFLCLGFLSPLSSAVTPTDVFLKASEVTEQVAALKALRAKDFQPRVPGIQVGKTPLHAYGKALELLEKIQRYQREQQAPELKLPELPQRQVKPADVLSLMSLAQRELSVLQQRQNMSLSVFKAPAASMAKTPSDVYEQIWQASYLMDAMVEPIKPAHVMRNVDMIAQGLARIAAKMERSIELPSAQTYTTKKPVDVTIQLYKLLYKLALLERKMSLKPLLVPVFPAGKIKPEDAYDATGNVLADVTRITVKLDLPSVKRPPTPQGKITPNDVYAQVVRLNQTAAQLID
ncbi:MAG: hypothetical protein ACPG4U_11290 [Pseudomonadales bacterium]